MRRWARVKYNLPPRRVSTGYTQQLSSDTAGEILAGAEGFES